MKKILIVLISFAFISSISTVVSAETITDPTSDVYHWDYTGSAWGWDTNIGNKPNIDITELTYVVNGGQVTLSLKVAGTIENSEDISYTIWLNTTDSYYTAGWTNGEGYGMGMSTEEGSLDFDVEPEISTSGNTFVVTFDAVGTFTGIEEFWGFSQEFYDLSDELTGEYWADWAPESYSWYDEDDSDDTSVDDNGDDDTGDDDTGSTDSGDTGNADENTNVPPPSGTPGFEILALIAAFAAILLIIKKRE